MAYSLTPIPPPLTSTPRWSRDQPGPGRCCGPVPTGPPPVKRPCYASIRRAPSVAACTRLPEAYTASAPGSWSDDWLELAQHWGPPGGTARQPWCRSCQNRLWDLKKKCLYLMTFFREEMIQGRLPTEVPLSQLVSSRLAALDGAGGPSLLEACCDLCHAHGSQLRREALAMVQSLEVWCPATGIPIQAATTGQQATAPPTGGSGAPCVRAPDYRNHREPQGLERHCQVPLPRVSSPMPLRPPHRDSQNGGVHVPNYRRPDRIPMSLSSGDAGEDVRRGSTSDPEARNSGSSGTLGPVAQQAQQFLEQNIRYLLRPRPSLVQELAARNGCAVSMSSPESGQSGSPCSSLGLTDMCGLPPFAPAPSPAGSAPLLAPATTPSSSSCMLLASSTSFPHSLDGIQGTSYSSPCGTASVVAGTSPSAAASFFARAAQRLNLSSKKRRRHGNSGACADGSQGSSNEGAPFATRYSELIKDTPPAAPPALLRGLSRKDTGLAKIKVMLRVCPSPASADASTRQNGCSASDLATGVSNSSFLLLDGRKKQVTLYDPAATVANRTPEATSGDEASSATTPVSPSSSASGRQTTLVAAPKMFAFDAVFSQDATQTEVCSSALTELVQAVVNGTDACLFVYGPAGLGKTWTMLGGSGSTQELGVVPCAIAWLFRLINEHKQRTGARFSVRVSAVQVAGRSENLRDLLAEHANGTEGSGTAPGLYLRDDPVLGTKLMNYSELRAPTAEKAAFLLDAAIAAAAAANQRSEEDGRNTHFLFTLHVYQYRVDKSGRGGVAGGRSRLHLFDLGSCEKGSKAGPGAGPLSLSALGNVILALFNAQKRLPFRESKVTQLLKEALGSVTCRAAMIAHVSPLPSSYAETLATVQLASRVHRMRRKKLKYASAASGVCGDGVEGVCRPFMRTHALNEDGGPRSGSSDPEYTSSSEQSCDTVIYVGRHQDFTDNEGPPVGGPSSLHAVLSAPTPHNSPARSILSKTPDSPARSCNGTVGTTTSRPSSSAAGKAECVASPKAVRQENCSSPTVNDSPHKTSQHNSLKKVHRSPAKDVAKETVSNEKRTSDELWIDGPRFSKPRFDSRTLQQLQKEQWVDGPAAAAAAATALYGYMDDHKKNMVERWVHEHSRYVQSPGGSKKLKSSKSGKVPQADAESSANSTPEHRKARAHQEHKRKNSPERLCGRESVARTEDRQSTKHVKGAGSSQASRHNLEGNKASSVQEKKQDVHMVSTEEEQLESVQMQDSCLQVTEEEILAATCGWPSTGDENPLPEVDQGSSNGGSQGSHPLRVLSDDGLNLPSSFTDSRSVSVDLNRVGVGDDTDFLGHVYGGLTWRLLQGTLLQRRKERRRRLYGDDLSTAVKGDVLAEKLERIARLRKLTSPYFDNNNEGIPSLLVMRSGASSPTAGRYGSLPNRKQRPLRNSFCDDNDGSTDGSDCADVTSTKSEPAEFDLDKYDIQRLNIKPMNGLKLEAFYNSIQKSNTSLMGSQELSPPKLSPHGDALFQSYSDKLDLLAKDFGVFPNKLEPAVIDVQPQRRFSLGNANIACAETPAVVTSQKVLLYPDGFSDSSVDASGDCVSPAVCSSVRQQRRLSREGPDEEGAKTSQREDHAPGLMEKPSMRLNRMVSTSRGSPTQHPKSEHSSPKRAVVSSPKLSRKTASNNSVPAAPVNLKSHIQPVARAVASPTSSSCGTLTGCCSPTRSRSGAKNARPPVITKGPCANGKHCETKNRKGHKTTAAPNNGESSDNPLYRSVSTPSTPCCADTKPNDIQRAKTLEPDALPSPYATVTQARPTVRESSSGHGSSDSSSFKGVMKTIQVVQCSGTSSGYESIIMRDSTPASSSQDSGSEKGHKDCRGRKGSRKGVQGVSARSRSAPGRSPPQSPPVRRQPPMPGLSRHVQRWHQQHGHELRPRQPEDEVGCAGLLCCRLLDFY